MQEHNFVQMGGVSPEQLDDVLHEMLDYEHFWEFSCDVYDRLTDNTAFGSELIRRYVDTDIAATKVTYDQMYGIAMKRSIKNVIFNDPATIVFWSDGTKTVVKAEGEAFDPEKGLAMAIAKKSLGNEGNYYDIFRKWLPKEEKEEPKLSDVEKADDNTDILTVKQFAEKTGQSIKTIQRECRKGLHSGAMKVNNRWLIPYSGLVSDMDNFDARR